MGRIPQTLVRDRREAPIQIFAPDPDKAQAPIPLAPGASMTLGGAGATVNVSGWLIAKITPYGGNLTRWFNADTAKTATLRSDEDRLIALMSNIATINLKNNGATTISVEIEGM